MNRRFNWMDKPVTWGGYFKLCGIGDALDHFGEYEEDAVFARNDAKRCDYEILKDERTYAEFRKTLPTNI